MAEKMKEFVHFTDKLDDLDKAAWLEIIDNVETETGDNLETEVGEGKEEGRKVWSEIFPFVQIVRLGLASDTISRVERARLVSIILSEISGLLSPMELAGLCFTTAVNTLSRPRSQAMIIPFPLGAMRFEEKKEDETGTVI